MLSRFAYRVVAVFFCLLAIACVLVAIGCLVAQLGGHFQFIPMGIWAVFFAWLSWDCAQSAWRAGRYDPLYD